MTDRDLLFKKMRDKGYTYKHIGDHFGINGNFVREKIKKMERRKELDKDWGDLNLRFINAFKKDGYKSISEVKKAPPFDIFKIKNIGMGTVKKYFKIK